MDQLGDRLVLLLNLLEGLSEFALTERVEFRVESERVSCGRLSAARLSLLGRPPARLGRLGAKTKPLWPVWRPPARPPESSGRPAKLEGRSRAKAGPCNFDQRADSPTRPARESALRASLDGAPGSGAERGHQCRRAGRLAAARCCGLETCSAQQVDHSRGEIIHEIFIGRPASAAGVKRELQRGATRGRAESKPVASCEREPMKGARSCLVRAGEFYANLRRV